MIVILPFSQPKSLDNDQGHNLFYQPDHSWYLLLFYQVEDFHTYHVSGFSVLVHNASDLYARGSFRRSARQKAESEAPRNSNGKMKCPTCGKEIPENYTP